MQSDFDLSLSAPSPLDGEVCLPGDKSLSHRAALFAALAEGESVIDNFLVSGVTRAMLDALTGLGIKWRLDATRLAVTGSGLKGFRRPPAPVNCGNSATTMRMLAGALAASGIPATLDGYDGLRKRPMDRVIAPLTDMGVRIASVNGCAPLALIARDPATPLRHIDYALPVASAQVKSCLMLAGLYADGETCIVEPEPTRDHTERMLTAFGYSVRRQGLRVCLTGGGRLTACRLRIPADISSA